MGCKRAKFSNRGEDVSTRPATVNSSPKGTSVRRSHRKTGVVPCSRIEDHHHNKASGANTPTHSYQAQLDTKKYVRDSKASRAAPRAGCSSKRKGSPARNAFAGSQIRSLHHRQPRNTAPYTPICGCTRAVRINHAAACLRRFEMKQAIAKIVAGVESERAVTYGSMMTRAVPATGTLSSPASRATPLHRAASFAKQALRSLQDASKRRKMQATCQENMTKSMGRCISRA